MKYKHPQSILDQCVELFEDIKYFSPSEFKYPHKMDRRLLVFLDTVRDYFGNPIIITNDWRPDNTTGPSGSSKSSWHKKGRAVDFRISYMGPTTKWKLVDRIYQAQADTETPIELELVWSKKDKHGHIAILNAGAESKLIIAGD